MNQNIQIVTDACLLIFDPHQDVEWMRRIISKERGMVSHILLGGDYFDCLETDRHACEMEMADYLWHLSHQWGNRITILLGNHGNYSGSLALICIYLRA